MMRRAPPPRLCEPLLLLGLISLPLLWWLLRVCAGPRRIEFRRHGLVVRHCAEGGDAVAHAVWLTLLRLAAAALSSLPPPARSGIRKTALPQQAPLVILARQTAGAPPQAGYAGQGRRTN